MEAIQKREYSGRAFTEAEMELIKDMAATYPKLSQTELASTVCEPVGWTQTNGKPKTAQCVQFLRILAEEGVLALPVLNGKMGAGRGETSSKGAPKDNSQIDTAEMRECGSIKLDVIRPGRELRQWREYMDAYHRLGDPQVYGNQLRYTIRTDKGRDVGCMLFSASSWSLKPRDEWIGWNLSNRKENLHMVVNNSRFLIFRGYRYGTWRAVYYRW